MSGVLVGVLGTLAALFILRAAFFLTWRRRLSRRWRGPARRGRGWMLGRLFARLGTTPEQERLLLEEMDALRGGFQGLREGLFASRAELAAALAAEKLDPAALEALWAEQMARAESVKRSAVEALTKLHAVLEARQRQLLAEMVRSGGRAHGRC
jgi:Spy/CpxP family protein refolding chaperone